MSTPTKPVIVFPPNQYLQISSTIKIKWSHVLAGQAGGVYKLWVDDNTAFSSPTEYIINCPGSAQYPPNEKEVTLAPGTWYVKVQAYTSINGVDNLSAWSDYKNFTIDPTIAVDTDITDLLEENKNLFVPIVYGEFQRGIFPENSNGLAVAYLMKYDRNSTYIVAQHHINIDTVVNKITTNVIPKLFIPLPSNDVIPLVVDTILELDSLDRCTVMWGPTSQGKFQGQNSYQLSKKIPITPFDDSIYGKPSKYNALNRDYVFDGNVDTVATVIKISDKYQPINVLGFTPSGYATVAGAAWEIKDFDGSFMEIFAQDQSEIFINYANLKKLYTLNYTSADLDYHDGGELINFSICSYIDYADTKRICADIIDSSQSDSVHPTPIGNLKFNSTAYNTTYHLKKSAITTDVNRHPVFLIDVRLNMAKKHQFATDAPILTIGELDVQISYTFKAEDKKKALKAYVECNGRNYGSWISSFNIDKTLGVSLYSLYQKATGNQLTIEDSAMIIASLLIDYGGYTVSDFDLTSFAEAINPCQKMRVNITENTITINDIIKDICKQTAYMFVFTPSGVARLINMRTPVQFLDTVAATIPYNDVDIDTINIQKTPLDKVVNVISVKSRYHAETDKWCDYDTYENSASITKYGRKILTDPLEFKNVNSGPNGRDDDNVGGNSKSKLFYNSVKYPIVNLIEPDIQNGVADVNHRLDDGEWSNQHNMIEIFLPGYKYMNLEIGDLISFDNDSFTAHDLLCFGESWVNKQFRIMSITKTQDGVTISGIQKPDYNSYYELRGFKAFYGV